MNFLLIITLFSERAIATKFQIEAKKCKIDRETEEGVCMFNYECYKKQGTVLGTCIDGFLFGACCKLPKDNIEDNVSEISDLSDVINSVEEISSTTSTSTTTLVSSPNPEKFDNLPTFLSDSLSKSDLNKDDIDNEIDDTSESSQVENDSSSILDSIEVPLEIDNQIPSIILGNGSVVSLESLSLKPDLYKETESSTTSQQQLNNNQLFTWFTLDQIVNSTAA